MEHPVIPFSGEAVGPKSIDQTASWIKPEDKIPLLLCISLYGSVIRTIDTYELVDNTYKTRYAAWIDKTTRILIVGCRGTSIGKPGSRSDIKDDLVSFYLLSSNTLTLLHKSTIIVHKPLWELYASLRISCKFLVTGSGIFII